MPSSHDLDGLMKYLARTKWRDCFNEVFHEHVGPVLDATDLTLDDLSDIIGDNWTATLWGCAFEDFLTREYEVEGGNIVDDYLRRRRLAEPVQTRAYMKALRTSVMSLYDVSDVIPGQSLMARDVIRGGDQILVIDGTATKTLQQWDRIAARIVPVMGRNAFAGGLLLFNQQAAEIVFGGLREMCGEADATKLPLISDDDLQAVAAIFTNAWLFDTLKRVTGRPAIQNSDGDEIVFHNVRFPLTSGTTQKSVAARLNTISSLSRENSKFWNWLDSTASNIINESCSFKIEATMDNGACVLGNIELKGRFLHLMTNSAARAEKGTALIQQILGSYIGVPQMDIQTVDQMMEERPARDQAETVSDLPPDLIEQIAHDALDRHYLDTLDQPIRMLGNITPRQAAASPDGRHKVADWLTYLESQSMRHPNAADPVETYSFTWMWRELGVLDLRK